ncbi:MULTISPECIES: transposase [Microbacterium]|uniref:Transposase n=1 Tax=Microbacterium wangchenii TaxID=2541726 RepID=A0ABX5SNB7_9MICO|nr:MULTISPECIES: transposase [Microbacterium]MCK6068353.1 transposase [Microbacterium sp. EYE_512]QBR87629.1 transposase [Microbacterium wangchenii]TXK15897.1 transposase [Microbacterium wangchenii]
MADAVAELDAAADALYGLPPAEFTAARNERAASATGALAKRIKALRKPSVAAWAVNLLVRDGQLADALELSQALHEAQDELDAPELAKLGKQRRALVAGLARRAGALARDAGTPLSRAVLEEVELTINAAIVDAAAGAAILTGRLVRTVHADGIDAADLVDAVAGSVPGVPDRPAPGRDDLAARRARKAAEAAARDADRAASEADREAARIEGKLAKARERADLLHERVDDLRAELARIERDADAADEKVTDLQDEHTQARDRAKTAARAAQRARAAVEDAG